MLWLLREGSRSEVQGHDYKGEDMLCRDTIRAKAECFSTQEVARSQMRNPMATPKYLNHEPQPEIGNLHPLDGIRN